MSAAWAAVAVGVLLLAVVLVFIVQNSRSVRVSFFTLTWTLPLSVDFLLAAALGAVIVLLTGSARMLQLRLVARRQRRQLDTAPGKRDVRRRSTARRPAGKARSS